MLILIFSVFSNKQMKAKGRGLTGFYLQRFSAVLKHLETDLIETA